MLKKLLLTLPILLLSNDKFIQPDSFTKEGYCVVEKSKQRHIGLTRFDNPEDFKKYCNGKMIFRYKNSNCKVFTMEQMKFDIFISDGKIKHLFKIGERKRICSKQIIESLK
ncbi:MAG: hypothetical protein ACNI25_15675 [Halarcobacter sp.]